MCKLSDGGVQRTAIVNGQHEPTEEECDWKDDDDDIADMSVS